MTKITTVRVNCGNHMDDAGSSLIELNVNDPGLTVVKLVDYNSKTTGNPVVGMARFACPHCGHLFVHDITAVSMDAIETGGGPIIDIPVLSGLHARRAATVGA